VRAFKALAAVLVLYVAVLVVLFVSMRQAPTRVGTIMSHVPGPAFAVLPMESLWCAARKGGLRVGDTAPDFALKTLDGKQSVRLSSRRGSQPVVLVFGSYT
jgi:hypothetical protein